MASIQEMILKFKIIKSNSKHKNPAKGLMVYDSVANKLMVNMGSTAEVNWQSVSPAVATGNTGTWNIQGNAGTSSASNFIGTTDLQPLNFRVNNEPSGKINPKNGSIFLGQQAGRSDVDTLGGNTGIGTSVMRDAMGFGNTAVGSQAMLDNTNGSGNTAIGFSAIAGNFTGRYNVGVGYNTLFSTSTSWYNTVIGANSAVKHNNGYNNVFVGANNEVTGENFFNVIAIGQAVSVTASSQARFGNPATSSIGGYANWTNFSDGRFKKNMKENVKGLDFIMKLRPLTYTLDITGINSKLGREKEQDVQTARAMTDREKEVFCGFSAQEVEKAANESGFEFSGVDKPKNANDFYGLRYSDFVVPLVKGMQEQQQLIEELRKEVAELKKQITH